MDFIPAAPTVQQSEFISQAQIEELLPLTQYAGIDSAEIACLLYEAIRKRELACKEGPFPFGFILGELFHLGRIYGIREERAKRKAA